MYGVQFLVVSKYAVEKRGVGGKHHVDLVVD
jgi:hypothetical protein